MGVIFMAGALSDWDFRETTTKVDKSSSFSLSTDKAKTGSKSLKFQSSNVRLAAINQTYTNSNNGGKLTAWIYLPSSMSTYYLYFGLWAGAGWYTDNDLQNGIMSAIYHRPNSSIYQHYVGDFDTTGIFSSTGSKDYGSGESWDDWYQLEHLWKISQNVDGRYQLSIFSKIYDSSSNVLSRFGHIGNPNDYYNIDRTSNGYGTEVSVGMYLYSNSPGYFYADDFIAYE
jgi:hypothetical protein